MTGRGGVRASIVALAVLLAAVSACSSDASDDGPTTSVAAPAATSSSTSSTSTSTSSTSSTTTEVPPPGPKPVEQLDGLRPYEEGEGCALVLARLNAPSFPASLRGRFASGSSGYVSAAGVVDITASSGADDSADYDFYGFVTASAGSEVDQSTWFTLLERAQPAAGTPTWTVTFTRRADGTFTCEPLAAPGGG